jgi:hypothetical protein
MSILWMLLSGCALAPAAEPEPPSKPLRYVRLEKDKWVTESEVSTTKSGDVTVLVSKTERPEEKMTLTLRFDKAGHVTTAEAIQEKGEKGAVKKTALLKLNEKNSEFKQGGVTDFLEMPSNPVVTTAPDWCDVFQLLRRYDANKGGRQEFTGIWIHPVQPLQNVTFAIQKVGGDSVDLSDKRVKLDRYKVQLHSGEYLVWADSSGLAVKILPLEAKASPVVLEGYEELKIGQ